MVSALQPGQTTTTRVDVQRREVVMLDWRGWSWTFRNAPAFNLVRLERPDQGNVGTTLASAAASLTTTVETLLRALRVFWEAAINEQGPPPGEGTIDPEIPPAEPGPDPLLPGFPLPDPGGPIEGDPDVPGGRTVTEIQLSSLGAAIPAVIAILRAIGIVLARGIVVRWNQIPRWAQLALTAIGITAGTDILLDMGPGDEGWIDIPSFDLPLFPAVGGADDPLTESILALTASTWNANGVQFHRLVDGRLAVRNKHGVWKTWRPKKPIVIMPTGQADLKDLIRADNAIQKQAGKLAKMLRGRGYQVSRK